MSLESLTSGLRFQVASNELKKPARATTERQANSNTNIVAATGDRVKISAKNMEFGIAE
jgi:hypothetical protein